MAVMRRIGLVRRHVVGAGVRTATAVVFTATIVATSGQRRVRDDLHASGDSAGRTTTSRSVRGCSGSTEALVQLFEKRAPDIICRDVNGISNAHDDQ